MLDQHSQVSIAQIVFYVPAVIAAVTLLFFRRAVKGLPRYAWYVLTLFTLMRLAGGIVEILHVNNPSSTGLIIGATILLNTGVLPCIAATIGLINIITRIDYRDDRRLHYLEVASRLLFITAIALLLAGGILEGNYNDINSVQIGTKLVRAGYCVVAAFVGGMIFFQAFFWLQRQNLSHNSMRILVGTTLAMPLFIVRLTYAFLSIYRAAYDDTWNPLNGPIAPFLVMALLMEYCVVIIYMYSGFRIKATTRVEDDGESAVALK